MIRGIVGPTSSYKSQIAEMLVQEKNVMIINADSQQLLKGLPLLSAQPNFLKNHELYAIFDSNQKITVVDWAELVKEKIDQARKSNLIPILLGGTGFYFNILQNGIINLPEIDPKISQRLANFSTPEIIAYLMKYEKNVLQDEKKVLSKFKDRRRLEKALGIWIQTGKSIFDFWSNENEKLFDEEIIIFSIIPPISVTDTRIRARLDSIFPAVFDEVAQFTGESKVIGVEQIRRYFAMDLSFQDMFDDIFIKTRQYAKRQRTYIRNILKIEKNFENPKDLFEFLLNHIKTE